MVRISNDPLRMSKRESTSRNQFFLYVCVRLETTHMLPASPSP